ncbi:hypothetical protein PCANC_22046 [Puccinia coronata f. sp. avenae]|uniref:CxC1-like cysteine cluster associated with KDZ transposases domain-containing protein n=1 Tax=Puccinia coronata f. sp. avenae TaxID=200324 RepID=A0A2N5TNH7_9BASI|nr:hypothetical protein PCANC_22046 [Puccinia coronata f. sp. avenae]
MPRSSFSRFHSASQLPTQESKRAKRLQLNEQKESRAALSRLRSSNQPIYIQQPPEESNHDESIQFNVDIDGAPKWIDEELNLSDETQDSLRQIRLQKERILQQNKQRRWVDLMAVLLPTYLHMKQVTSDWITSTWDQDRSSNGYIGSTPAFPQTAFSVRLLNFYNLLWNLCNSHATPFAEVMRRWNEPRSQRLLAKKSTKPRELRRNLSGAIDAYRYLKRTQQQMIKTVTSPHPQDRLAQRSCPSCFGRSHPDLLPKKNDCDIFICLDGNFQHRHHEHAEKGHLSLQTPVLFIPPDEVEDAKEEIRQHELALRKSDKAWQKQCSFESNQKQADIEKKQEISQHLERKEQLRLLAESFNSMVGTSKQGNDDALAILDNIHQLQKAHDEQLIKAGGYFNDLNAHDKDCEEHLAPLWSAKSQLFKKAVEIQSELQPLKNSKNRVKVIKTFCEQRCKYLSKFALELVNLPEKQPFDYSNFLAMTLDDPIWNNGFLCTSKEPWAVEPIVRNGIHAFLAFDRANEEIDRITIDLQHALSWGVYHHKQLTQAKDKCSHEGSEDRDSDDIVCFAAKKLGGQSDAGFLMGKTILQGDVETSLEKHWLLLLSWNDTILDMLSNELTNRSNLPRCWFELLGLLLQNVDANNISEIDEDMEKVELDDGDSDEESVGVAMLDGYEEENNKD